MTAFVCQKCYFTCEVLRKGDEEGFSPSLVKDLGTGHIKCPRCGADHFVFERFPPAKGKDSAPDLMLMLY